MFVTIDLEELKFVHKTPAMLTCANLAWIEMHNKAYSIDNYSAKNWLSYMTDMEMKILYRNTTNQETHHSGNYLRAILADLAESIDEVEVNALEAEVQAGKVNEEDEPGYEYAFGSMRPARPQGFFPEALTTPRREDEAKLAALRVGHYVRAPIVPPAAPCSPARTGPVTAPATRRPAAVQGAPRRGGAREIIWQVADTMWENAGKPTDKKEILSLRKRMMEVLESDHGVKKTTSSNELGNWQKNRCP